MKRPKVRGVCDASEAYNSKLSYVMCLILNELTNGVTVCQSTEEMIAAINESNSTLPSNIVIGSMDVVSLYPSLNIESSIEIVKRTFIESNLIIEGINDEDLGLYISLNLSQEEIDKNRWKSYCPIRKGRRGQRPTMTGNATSSSMQKRYEQWWKPKRKMNAKVKREILGEAIKIAMTLIMKKHIYKFNGKIRKQKDGGPIGLDLTGTIAQIVMIHWDKKFRQKLENLGINIYLDERYVDDKNICVTQIEPGNKYDNGHIVYKQEEIATDINIPADKRTFEIINMIANEIDENIKFTYDVPSNYEDEKLPILDMKVWIKTIVTEEGTENSVIMHEYYMKEVSSKYLIMAKSAMSWGSKRTILTQECLRIILNCSQDLQWKQIAEHLSIFTQRMQLSGYDKQFRYEIVKSAINAFMKMKENEINNIRPIHRPKNWKINERKIEKEKKKQNWFNKDRYNSVLFIPPTPSSALKSILENEIIKSKFKIKVVEKTGKSIKKCLQKSDPFKKEKCTDKECWICQTENGGDCRAIGITYKIECKTEEECKHNYKGNTARNGYTRGEEHKYKLKSKDEKSVLWRHVKNQHSDKEAKYNMKVIDKCRNNPLERQLYEAVRIRRTEPSTLLNEKDEWNMIKLPKVQVTYRHLGRLRTAGRFRTIITMGLCGHVTL